MLRIIVCSLFFLTLCRAQVSLDSICSALAEQGVLSSEFTQTKTIKGIPVPLTSTGTLVVDVAHGIVWQTRTPFPATLLLSKTGIYQVDGSKKKSLTNGQDRGIMAILSKLLHGQFNQITEFKITVKDDSRIDQWNLNLIAQGAISKIIKSIDLEGDSHIQKITVLRVNGDKDQIDLKNHQIDPTLSKNISSLLRS